MRWMIRGPALPPAPDPPPPEQLVRGFDGFGEDGAATLIRGDDGPLSATPGVGAPLAGPPAFALAARRVEPGTPAALGATDDRDAVVLHVISGALEVAGETAADRPLGARSTLYLGGGEARALRCASREACVLVETRYRDPGGTARARRGTRVELPDVTPVRARFPVRLAPRMNAILSPRDLYPLVGPVVRGPGRFAIRGPDGLVLVTASTPKGTGPALHVHTLSTEMFVVLSGAFRLSWGDAGEREARLGPLDAIVVPTGLSRAFEAVEEGSWILPVVVGANDETEDIAWLPPVGRALLEAGPRLAAAVATRTSLRIRERASG